MNKQRMKMVDFAASDKRSVSAMLRGNGDKRETRPEAYMTFNKTSSDAPKKFYQKLNFTNIMFDLSMGGLLAMLFMKVFNFG